MFSRAFVQNPLDSQDDIRKWSRARIVMRDGKLDRIVRRRFTGSVSVAQVWYQAKFRRPEGDVCYLDYHQPGRMHGVLTLDYILSGDQATYRTFVGACHVLDAIARIRESLTIVAHVSNRSISDRFLNRLGWESHLEHLSGRHWIKRFYDGYPPNDICRYLTR
ncbi:MAG: hypothetical protein AAF989_05785 [Planctomycetota bacterium]